ncbi:MAG: DUF6644 family protein [Hyphomicrobium aestuarii]|nr:DUF6644 family protein [Hyphomicrobium aestuarii]
MPVVAAMSVLAAAGAGASLVEILAAIGQVTGVARSAVIYAAVSAGHVLGIALLLGPIILADLAIVGVIRTLDGPGVATLRWTARFGVVVAIATGILLASSKPAEYFANWAFWAKMIVLLLALSNAIVFECRVIGEGDSFSRIQAGVSIVLWLTVLALGRWIAFV